MKYVLKADVPRAGWKEGDVVELDAHTAEIWANRGLIEEETADPKPKRKKSTKKVESKQVETATADDDRVQAASTGWVAE